MSKRQVRTNKRIYTQRYVSALLIRLREAESYKEERDALLFLVARVMHLNEAHEKERRLRLAAKRSKAVVPRGLQ